MDYEENMVEQTEAATEEESFEDADVVEEEVDTSESLDSFTKEEETPADEKQSKSQGTSAPGWFQSRWNKNVEKLTAQIREEMREEMRNEYEGKLAPLMERLLEMDAKELVKSGEFKSIDRAKEYLQLKQGISPTVTEKPAEQPRSANGQFAPKQDAVTQARIDLLANQADKIKGKTGIDVIEIMNNDPNIKNKILSGEMDFYEVAEAYKQKPAKKGPPAPTRSSNGASGQSPNAIDSMSKEQFARLEKKISEGARISLK